jgi:hypothetical protein
MPDFGSARFARESPRPHIWQGAVAASDLGLLALAVILLHILTNGHYRFHRDELIPLNYALHLAGAT